MPAMSGLEFLRTVRTQASDTVRLMLTGNSDQKTAMDAVNGGHVFRFLTKPCPPPALVPALAGSDIPIGTRILKVLGDLVDFETRAFARNAAFQQMQERIGWYDLEVLSAVSRWCDVSLAGPKKGLSNPQPVRIDQIRNGQILAQDLRTRDGLLIMAANTELTSMLLAKLLNFGTLNTIDHTLLVDVEAEAA